MTPGLRKSKYCGLLVMTSLDLRSPGVVVKITTRALKIGVQSRFYPISTVGFRTFFLENFGQAYCTPMTGFFLGRYKTTTFKLR